MILNGLMQILQIMDGKCDPSTNQALIKSSIKQKLDFNLDLNGDGRIGAPPNNNPLLTGIPSFSLMASKIITFPTLEGGQEFTIWESDLLEKTIL